MDDSMTRVRATHLALAQHCPGSPSLQRLYGNSAPAAEGEPIKRGLIGHAYLEIALSIGWGAAARWLAKVPAAEAELAVLADPEFQRWVVEDVLDGRRGLVEQFHLLKLDRGCVSMRWDWESDDLATEEGSVLVVDWKFGRGQRWFLPPVADDLQMVSYGLAALAQAGSADHAQARVKRVRVDDREVDELLITRETAVAVLPWLQEIVAEVDASPDDRRAGLHCSACWARQACTERLSQVEPTMEALSLPEAPLGALTPQQAALWAQGRGALKERVAQLDEALIAYLDSGGKVRREGQRLKVNRYNVERVDAPGESVLEMASSAAGQAGVSALKTSKGALVDAMKSAGLDKEQRDQWLNRWRDQGLLTSAERTSLRWVKDKEVIDVG